MDEETLDIKMQYDFAYEYKIGQIQTNLMQIRLNLERYPLLKLDELNEVQSKLEEIVRYMDSIKGYEREE